MNLRDLHLDSIIRKLCLGFLVVTIIGVSINNGILTLRATYYYAVTDFPWYEWMNYFFLGIFVLICPILSLFFLDSIHVRRLLRIFCFGMALNNVLEVMEGTIDNFSTLFGYERPFNAIYILVEFVALVICWLFLLRQIRGRSLLPIPIKTDRRGFGSFLRNLKDFLATPIKKNKKLVNVVIIVNVICFIGVFATLLPEGTEITLQRPEDHQMAIKFWAGDADDLNSTEMKVLADNNVELYCWMGESDAKKYADNNISTKVVKSMPSGEDPTELANFYDEIDDWMDFADADVNVSKFFKGFIADDEGLHTIAKVNTTQFENEIEVKRQGINYINSRGYNYSYTTVLANIGDRYDADLDMDLVYGNPFDPVQYENLSAINWMVYRAEKAMIYDEPFEYFTYQWATYITDYMHYLEDLYGYERGYWANRSGMSIGVSSDELYIYNTDLRSKEAALDELIQDAKICHACGIGEITVFYLPMFMKQWGQAGLERFINEINTYTTVTFKYHRRATYFGNLKWASNINGSVFGLFYCDGLYEQWFGYLGLIWIILLVIVPWFFLSRKFGINDEIHSGFGKRGASSTDDKEDPMSDKLSFGIRLNYLIWPVVILSIVFFVAEIFVFSPEFVQWVPWYWDEVALDEPWFIDFWDAFKTQYVYFLIAGIILLFSIPVGIGKLIDWYDKRKARSGEK